MTEYQYGSYGSSYESGCDHLGITEVMRLGKATIYAGSRHEAEHEYGWDLIINLLGTLSSTSSPVRMNKEAALLLPPSLTDFKPSAVMAVDWPDGGTPVMDEKWWDDLYTALVNKVEGDVVIHCQGGHGRTGTALSILAAKAGPAFMRKGCPVLWVRKTYCEKAVETTSQIAYIEAMTGVKVKAISSAAVAQQKREAEDKARARTAAANPMQMGSPPSGVASGAGTAPDEWVWDRGSNSLVRKSELKDEQDWEGSHWGRML